MLIDDVASFRRAFASWSFHCDDRRAVLKCRFRDVDDPSVTTSLTMTSTTMKAR